MSGKRASRVFISSPSDIRPERLVAERIVAPLDREFAYYFHIEAVLWKRERLLATHRQRRYLVVRLWSPLGLPLPEDQFRGALSGRAVTGAEWEFEDALAAPASAACRSC